MQKQQIVNLKIKFKAKIKKQKLNGKLISKLKIESQIKT